MLALHSCCHVRLKAIGAFVREWSRAKTVTERSLGATGDRTFAIGTFARGDGGQNVHEGTFAKGDEGENVRWGTFAKGDGGENVREGTFAKGDGGENIRELGNVREGTFAKGDGGQNVREGMFAKGDLQGHRMFECTKCMHVCISMQHCGGGGGEGGDMFPQEIF